MKKKIETEGEEVVIEDLFDEDDLEEGEYY